MKLFQIQLMIQQEYLSHQVKLILDLESLYLFNIYAIKLHARDVMVLVIVLAIHVLWIQPEFFQVLLLDHVYAILR